MQTKQDIPYGQPPEQQMMAVPVGHESGAPWQSGDEIAAASGLTIKQATSECCKFFCCQPNIHFNIHPFKDGNKLDPQENLPTIGFIQVCEKFGKTDRLPNAMVHRRGRDR